MTYLGQPHNNFDTINLEAIGNYVNDAMVDGNTPLHIACSLGNTDMLIALLNIEGIDVNAKNIEGNTPLHIACSLGRIDMVKPLLNVESIDINAKDSEGFTPLHDACRSGDTETVKAMLNAPNIDVNAEQEVDSEQFTLIFTPFGLACFHGQQEVVKVMLQDPRINREAHKLDILWAQINGHHTIAEMIMAFDAHSSSLEDVNADSSTLGDIGDILAQAAQDATLGQVAQEEQRKPKTLGE